MWCAGAEGSRQQQWGPGACDTEGYPLPLPISTPKLRIVHYVREGHAQRGHC